MKIRVHSKLARFRRAGIVFGREPVMLDAAELGAERLAQLEAEPRLVVEYLNDTNTETTAKEPAAGNADRRPGKGAKAGAKEAK